MCLMMLYKREGNSDERSDFTTFEIEANMYI